MKRILNILSYIYFQKINNFGPNGFCCFFDLCVFDSKFYYVFMEKKLNSQQLQLIFKGYSNPFWMISTPIHVRYFFWSFIR